MEREAAFLFVDLAGFTALTEAHGDVDAADVVARFYDLAAAQLAGDARIVKTIGDAVMIAASRPIDAVRSAVGLHASIVRTPAFPRVRAGLHAGTAVERAADYIGAAVNLAARVAAHARSGQILCTAAVASCPEVCALATAASLGEVAFKNIARPVEIFELMPREAERDATEIDPVCRMRVDPACAAAVVRHGPASFYFCSEACARQFEKAPGDFLGRR